jgi:Na+-translocating ferredoxin:NAD+ oxidoreductase subunit B
MPLLVGIVEWHDTTATPQFGADLGEYMRSGFIKAYAATKTSQMRTVPVEKSIKVEHHVTTYDNIREIIKNTGGPITVSRCMCREGAGHRGKPCHQTSRLDTCMSFGDWAKHFIKKGAREITREEALEITRQNEEDGLVLQPTNYQKIDFICACCGCCCGILNIQKMIPKPAENWASNYFAAVEAEKCTACGICVDKCQVNAARMNKQNDCSSINLDRCIGCGNCVTSCPSEAIRLVRKEKETVPPEDRTSLYKILAEK